MKKREETTLPVEIHSWDYPTSKYCLRSSLIIPLSPTSMLFPLAWESTVRKVSDHSVLSLPCEPVILQGRGGGRVPCLYCSRIQLHYITLPFWPLPYIMSCCHSALCDQSGFWNPCFWDSLRNKGQESKAEAPSFDVTSRSWTTPTKNRDSKVVSKQRDFIYHLICIFSYLGRIGLWNRGVVSFPSTTYLSSSLIILYTFVSQAFRLRIEEQVFLFHRDCQVLISCFVFGFS